MRSLGLLLLATACADHRPFGLLVDGGRATEPVPPKKSASTWRLATMECERCDLDRLERAAISEDAVECGVGGRMGMNIGTEILPPARMTPAMLTCFRAALRKGHDAVLRFETYRGAKGDKEGVFVGHADGGIEVLELRRGQNDCSAFFGRWSCERLPVRGDDSIDGLFSLQCPGMGERGRCDESKSMRWLLSSPRDFSSLPDDAKQHLTAGPPLICHRSRVMDLDGTLNCWLESEWSLLWPPDSGAR